MHPRVILTAALALASASCKRGGGDPGAPAPAASASTASIGDCVEVAPPQRFAAGDVGDSTGPVPFSAELGSASLDEGGWLVGVRAPGALGEAKLLRLALDGGSMREVATWLPPAGVARAPKVATSAGAAPIAILASAVGDRRTVKIARLASGKLEELAALPPESDESEAIAAIATSDGALVAWDDADETGAIGRVRMRLVTAGAAPASASPAGSASAAASVSPAVGASAAASASASAARTAGAQRAPSPAPADTLSPPTSDASFPVLVSLGPTRAVALWLAERPESDAQPDGGSGEPSQEATFRWIEAVVVDVPHARAIGPVVALTAKGGHAQVFSAERSGDTLLVAVRDDARPTDGDGGSDYVVASALPANDAANAVGAPRTLARVDEGVAAGLPTLLVQAHPWLLWLGPQDDAHAVPALARPTPKPIAEPLFDGRRVAAQGNGMILTSRLRGAGLELALRRCALHE